jgi:hypothetical protein
MQWTGREMISVKLVAGLFLNVTCCSVIERLVWTKQYDLLNCLRFISRQKIQIRAVSSYELCVRGKKPNDLLKQILETFAKNKNENLWWTWSHRHTVGALKQSRNSFTPHLPRHRVILPLGWGFLPSKRRLTHIDTKRQTQSQRLDAYEKVPLGLKKKKKKRDDHHLSRTS